MIIDAIAPTSWRVTHVGNVESAACVEPDVCIIDAAEVDIAAAILDIARRSAAILPPVLVLVDQLSAAQVGDLVRLGVSGVLSKPVDREALTDQVARSVAARMTRRGTVADEAAPDDQLVGESPALRKIRWLVERANRYETRLVIQGETGTGKEEVARYAHRHSRRREGPFVPVNCAAVPEPLFESEMFGTELGAFTGARRQAGWFEAAAAGTLFLDEVTELPVGQQAKLLRAIDQGEVTPIGSRRARPAKPRIICATNRNLFAQVQAGEFREDLYYRLAAMSLVVPPLRDRPDDIPLLAAHALHRFNERHHASDVTAISAAALLKLQDHRWPGNVRQLFHAVGRAVTFAAGAVLLPSDFQIETPETRSAVCYRSGRIPCAMTAGLTMPLPKSMTS